MAMKLKVTKSDGSIVELSPHFTQGRPNLYNSVGEPNYSKEDWERLIGYQQGILDRIREWNLYEYIGEPGRMEGEYRKRRRNDPRLEELVRITKIIHSGDSEQIKQIHASGRYPTDYVLPSTARKGSRIDADWMIDRELEAVFVFVLTNTNADPRYRKENKTLPEKELDRVYNTEVVSVRLHPSAGCQNVNIPPGASIPIPFCGDKALASEDGLRRPAAPIKIEPYDHSNPKHNSMLRNTGTYRSITTFDERPSAKPNTEAVVVR